MSHFGSIFHRNAVKRVHTVNMPHKTYTLDISFAYSDRILVVQLFNSENEELKFLMYIFGCMPEGVLFEN